MTGAIESHRTCNAHHSLHIICSLATAPAQLSHSILLKFPFTFAFKMSDSDPTRSEGHLCLPKRYTSVLERGIDKLLSGNFHWLMRKRIRLAMTRQKGAPFPSPILLKDQTPASLEHRWDQLTWPKILIDTLITQSDNAHPNGVWFGRAIKG